MITITDKTQRIFFEPNESLDAVKDICFDPPVWLLKFGVWSDCGVWDDSGEWKDTPSVLLADVILTDGAGVEVLNKQKTFNKDLRLPFINIDFFNDVPDDDYTLTILLEGDVIYQTRVKILRQSVNRVKRSQPVTTRKVNRTVSL